MAEVVPPNTLLLARALVTAKWQVHVDQVLGLGIRTRIYYLGSVQEL